MLDSRLFSRPAATSTAICLGPLFSRINHSSSHASLTTIRETLGSPLRKGDAMLGPSLSDWPIQSGRPSTVGRPPSDARSTRYDLARAHYLERQEAHRAAIMASRKAARIRLGLQPLLSLTSFGRFLKVKAIFGWRVAVRSARRTVHIAHSNVFDRVDPGGGPTAGPRGIRSRWCVRNGHTKRCSRDKLRLDGGADIPVAQHIERTSDHGATVLHLDRDLVRPSPEVGQ